MYESLDWLPRRRTLALSLTLLAAVTLLPSGTVLAHSGHGHAGHVHADQGHTGHGGDSAHMPQGSAMAEPAHVPPGSPMAQCDCPSGLNLETAAWVRSPPPGMPNTAAYMTLSNGTESALRIVGAESPAARVTELHDHVHGTDGVMRMRQVEYIEIPAGGQVRLQPGGLHVMLIGLEAPLAMGQAVPITLDIEGLLPDGVSQAVPVTATVQRAP